MDVGEESTMVLQSLALEVVFVLQILQVLDVLLRFLAENQSA